jgi:pre-mRNA-splicing helicase BRR2
MDETWWLVVGDATTGELIALRRVVIGARTTTSSLAFEAPEEEGEYDYWVYLMCGSYLGIDQQQPLHIVVSGEVEEEQEEDE